MAILQNFAQFILVLHSLLIGNFSINSLFCQILPIPQSHIINFCIHSDNHAPSCHANYASLMKSHPAFPFHLFRILYPEIPGLLILQLFWHIQSSFTELRNIPIITIVHLPLTYVGNTWIAIGPCSLWGFFLVFCVPLFCHVCGIYIATLSDIFYSSSPYFDDML